MKEKVWNSQKKERKKERKNIYEKEDNFKRSETMWKKQRKSLKIDEEKLQVILRS